MNREVYMAFMDLEKTYGRIDSDALWEVLRIYGIGGSLLNHLSTSFAHNEIRILGRCLHSIAYCKTFIIATS